MSKENHWASLLDEKPFDITNYSEAWTNRGASLQEAPADCPDIGRIISAMDSPEGFAEWMDANAGTLDPGTVVVNTDSPAELESLAAGHPMLIVNRRGMNRIRHLNTLLNRSNELLAPGGYLWCHARTSGLKREMIVQGHPGFVGKVMYALHFFWHRAMARMRLTRWIYMAVTKGKNRSYNRVELLGRMSRAGFKVIDERFHQGEFFLLGRKVDEPIWKDDPSNGILIKLNRVGYKGKMIGVYKFRTMYPYSEYLQPYMLDYAGLDNGGKFANDFRVNYFGRKLRGHWLDEIPMIINVLKGEMKLVGVRPLSPSYLALYKPEMQSLHISVKPGLVPPFYFEDPLPETLEDVQESEKKYIEAWQKHHFRTDWRYFWRVFGNILFNHKRSR